MTKKIFIGVAWPYANGPLHLGHIAGAYLPADIFARYHRLKGDEVLMVSGSDQHGTPVTVRAEQEGSSPQSVVARYHEDFLRSWRQLGISFDLFTRTGTDRHIQTTHDIFLNLLDRGYIRKGAMTLLYCRTDKRFLPDRYVEGRCPHCGYDGARGDQCDNCGRPLNGIELEAARCRLCGGEPEMRESEHFFLQLGAFSEKLKEWVSGQTHWRKNVYNFTMGLLNEGLRERAITRDIDWGVPVPVPGYEDKRIYVWFEAVIGYLSASKEWAAGRGEPDSWQGFWLEPGTESYYFIGKDNIPFHTIIWPAMLLALGGLNLPYDVPANQYLTMSGAKASTSRGWAIWLSDFLERYDVDALRYYLSAIMPESADADFTWFDFIRKNNDELVANWGNLVHRVLTFTYRHCQGRVPNPGMLTGGDRSLLIRAEETLTLAGEQIERRHLRAGLDMAMGLAREANRYLEENAPWKLIQHDRERAETALFTALNVINGLKVAFYPYMPSSSQELHRYLGYAQDLAQNGWRWVPIGAGSALVEPKPLFKKLDASLVEEEERRLGVV